MPARLFFTVFLITLSAGLSMGLASNAWSANLLASASGNGLHAQKTVYITVDDGPLSGFSNILEVVNQEQVPVTFFMVGQHIEASETHRKNLAAAKEIPYVVVANHSYSHAHEHYVHFYSDTNMVVDDLKRNSQILGLSGNPVHARLPGRDVFRIPGLSFDDPYITAAEDRVERVDFDAVFASGFFLYGWDLEWAHRTTGQPIQSVDTLMMQIAEHFAQQKTKVPNHLILLMHDQMFPTHLNGKENFRNLVQRLKNSPYNLATIDQYPNEGR